MEKQPFYLGIFAAILLLLAVALFQFSHTHYGRQAFGLQQSSAGVEKIKNQSTAWLEPEALAYIKQSVVAPKMLAQKQQEVAQTFKALEQTTNQTALPQISLLNKAFYSLHEQVLAGISQNKNSHQLMAEEGYVAARHIFLETYDVVNGLLLKEERRANALLSLSSWLSQGLAFVGLVLLLGLVWFSLNQKRKAEIQLAKNLNNNEEEKLRAQNRERQLQEARHAAEEALAEKTIVLRNISGALKNSISGVISVGDLLLGTRLSPKQEDLTRTFLDSAHYLNTTLDDLQDFAEIEAGSVKLRQFPFSLTASLEEVLDLFSAHAYESRVELLLDDDENLPPVLVGDAARIRQMVAHMSNHLLQRLSKGHLLIEAELVKKYSKSALLKIHIIASGKGISDTYWDETCATLMEDIHDRSALSLPLLISRRLAELMDFKIITKPSNDEQFVMTFEGILPVGVAEDAPQQIQASNLPKARVLVLDDHEISQRIITQKLLRHKVRCSAFASLENALKAAHQAYKMGDPFHIVLASTALHGVSAQEIATAFAADNLLRDIKLVALAAVAHKGDVKSLSNAGYRGYITKPLRPDEMLCVLEYVVANESDAMVTRHTVKEVEDESTVSGKALLLESDANHSKITRVFLENEGCVVMEASNAGQAIDLFARQKFDLIVLDLNYHGHLGAQSVLVHFREREKALHQDPTPILGIASGLGGDEVRASLESGLSDFIQRPITRERLHTLLLKWLSKYKKEPEA